MKNVFFVAIFLLAIQTGFAGNNEGKTLPSAQVEDLNGKKIDFKDAIQAGKFYVVTFWATWCVPCKKELSNMIELAPKWKENFNAEIIAISADDSRAKAKVKAYVAGENWPYTVLLDPNQDLMRSLGIQSMPYTLIIDDKGKIVFTHNAYVEGDEFEIENKLQSLQKK